jgi:hypothetical protein
MRISFRALRGAGDRSVGLYFADTGRSAGAIAKLSGALGSIDFATHPERWATPAYYFIIL